MNIEKKTKRIGIDARFYGPIGKGLGRYTQEIVDNIIKLDQENEYVIFLRQENFSAFYSANPKVKKVRADVRWYTLAEQILMPYYIWRQHLDLIHFPHFNVPIFCPVKFTVTIHDLILIKFPTMRATTLGPIIYKLKNFAYNLVIGAAVKRAKKILTVSEFTKNEIAKQFKVKPKKIIVTYEGVADFSFPSDKEGLRWVNQPYLLYVGNAYPHKNLEGLIRVFSKIKAPLDKKGLRGLKLILVGKEDYFYSRLKNFAKDYSADVIFPGYVSDSDLKVLYQNALAYVFPSFYEGFGLPPLEAMEHGLAVVSSDKTSLTEILGEAPLYFNPENENEMQAKIESVIKDENLRQELIKRGYQQVKKYSWIDCAEKTLEVYKNILK